MADEKQLRLVLVTPEVTLVDEPVDSVRFPLYDGQMGVLPGRAPVVGRLGCGELRFTGGGREGRYFIDGGFVQIKGPVVTILTDRAIPADEIDRAAAERDLEEALARPAQGDEQIAARQRDQQRARQKLAVATK